MIMNRYLAFIVLLFPLHAIAAKETVPPPLNVLLSDYKEWGHVFSPSGKYIAHIERIQNVNMLEITDTALGKPVNRINLGGFYGTNLSWLNDLELAFEDGGRIIAINARGEDRRALINNIYDADSEESADRLYRNWHLIALSPDDNEHMILSSAGQNTDWEWLAIHKVNMYTGEKLDIRNGADLGIDNWYLDVFGNPRMARKKKGGVSAYSLYESAGKGSKSLVPLSSKKSGMDFSSSGDSPAHRKVELVGFSLQDKLIYIEERVSGDRYKLVSYDPVEDRVIDVLLENDRYDIDAGLHFDKPAKQLIGATFTLDQSTTVWFDKRVREYQRKIDALHPDTVNRIFQMSPDLEYFLVQKTNSKGFDTINLYTAKTNSLTVISDRTRGLSDYTLAETKKISYQARDGYSLEGFLTIPPGLDAGKPMPLIVDTLDDPWSRHTIGYSAQHQFFATRGYAVFRPNHRGSTGYGKKHMLPNNGNLSDVIYDDIADGVQSLIKSGAADPGRIFLSGKYYGGQFAILSSLRYPDLYKGIVARNAILDLVEQYDFLKDKDYYSDQDFCNAITGSPRPSGKLLQQHSPQHRIADIKTPLLVFHGKDNKAVDVKQAENFKETAEKLKNAKITVRLIDKESHSNWDSNNEIYFLEKSLEFLMKNGAVKTP